jgi:hypothetical protein
VNPRAIFNLLTKVAWDIIIYLSLTIPGSLFLILALLHESFYSICLLRNCSFIILQELKSSCVLNLLMASSAHFEAISRQQLAVYGPSPVSDSSKLLITWSQHQGTIPEGEHFLLLD